MSGSPESPQARPDVQSFPHRKVDVKGIQREDPKFYGQYLGDIRRMGSLTPEQIRGTAEAPGIHSMDDLASDRWFAALPVALSDLAERTVRLGLAEEIRSPSGIHKVKLVDTNDGHSQIEITTHKDYRQVRIVDTTDPVVIADELHPRTLFSLQIPNHMTDSATTSTFHATRHDTPGAIDLNENANEETIQAFAGVISAVAQRI